MKTRTQIILFVIIIAFGSVATFTISSMYQSQIEWHEKVGGLKDVSSDEQHILPIDDGITSEELERDLQMILSDCTPPKYKGFAYGLSYSNETHYIDNNSCEWKLISEKIVTGSYELEEALCIGGRGMILNEKCERIGKYDPETGISIVENKEQCDMLEGDWEEQQKICDSKYGGK